jgi:hypothetical protein
VQSIETDRLLSSGTAWFDLQETIIKAQMPENLQLHPDQLNSVVAFD